MVYIILLSLLVLVALTAGFTRSQSMMILFYFKSFRNPFFHFGLSCIREVYKDKIIDVVTFGFFFFVLELEFYKSLVENPDKNV